MMKEELEKRVHDIAELLYEQGYDDGCSDTRMCGERGYKKGLEDAWECIRIFRNLSEKEREKIFDTIWLQDILCHFKPLEFVQKIKEYEERQKQDATDMNDGSIKVGDEVRIKESDPFKDDCDYGVCTISLPCVNKIYVMRKDGSCSKEDKDEWYRTGRTFPQIAEVLEQLRGVRK